MKTQKKPGLRFVITVMVLLGLCHIASAADKKAAVTGRVDTVNDAEADQVSTVKWSEAALTAQGEQLLAKYAAQLEALKKEISATATVPALDAQKKAAFINAHAAVQAVPAQPNPKGAKLAPPQYAPSNPHYAVAQSNALLTAATLLADLDAFLASDKFDAKLAKTALLSEATPRMLALFAQQGKEEESLIDELLGDDKLIQQIMELGGCYQGKYPQAMQIYKAIQKASKRASEGFFQRFALASAMEHPDGCITKEGKTAAEVMVEIYLDYEKAYLAGLLDSAFGTYSDFNWRFVMYNSGVEDMNWMRTMLRNYRPDHIVNTNFHWRYCAIVKTDVPYTGGVGRPVRPDLNLTRFQDFFLEGGICGPRCFVGKLSTAAFGIPTRGARQTGHAAMCRWTPTGWTTVFGAGWAFNSHRDICGLDFSLEERARCATNEYMKVLRAEWVGQALGEKKVSKSQYGIGGDFWSALALYKKLAIIEKARIAELAATGAELAESNEPAESPASDWTPDKSKVSTAPRFPVIEMTEADKTIVFGKDGVITIPPAACTSPESTDKIKFMRTADNTGVQVHYALAGQRPELLKYTFELPADGKYELLAKVCTVTVDRKAILRVNRRTLLDLPLPYTKGMWEDTKPVVLDLTAGRNTIMFTAEVPNKGVSIKNFTLKPVK
jgi:hypothetical protein